MTTKTSAAQKTAATPGAATAPPTPDREDGRADFEALASEYQQLSKDLVVTPRLDVQAAITHALGIAQRVNSPKLRPLFISLPETQFPHTLLDQLPKVARAARHAFLRLTTTTVSRQTVKVALEVMQESTEVRGRMLSVCKYHLGDQSDYAEELRDIQQGQGYQDLADDLERLAALYKIEAAAVQADTKHYRADDRARALQLAAQILAEVNASDENAPADAHGGKVPAAREAANRAFALLTLCYNEVAAAGRYLLRHENGDEIFCSLYTAGRKSRTSRPAPSSPPSPADV